jgi:uncharacterized protein YaeQ
MALGATIYHLQVELSDVDRAVYQTLDLRVAQHPSETMRYLLTRVLAYCLSYQPEIAFSKGGVSSADEPPVLVRDSAGTLVAWIDVGSPSAERLERAVRSAERVLLFTHADPSLLRRETRNMLPQRLAKVEVWQLEPAFLAALEPKIERHTHLALLVTDGQLYATIEDTTVEGVLTQFRLTEEEQSPRDRRTTRDKRP